MRVRQIIKNTADFISESGTGIYAAQASFFLIISAIPFLMLTLSISGLFAMIDTQRLIHSLSAIAPAPVCRLAAEILAEINDKSASVRIISMTALSALWLSSRGITALYTGLLKLYDLPRRNYFYVRLVSVGYTLAFLAAILITIVFIGFGSRAEGFLMAHSEILSGALYVVLKLKMVILLIYLTLIFALFYKFVPGTDIKFIQLLPGAFFAAACWIIFSIAYSVYIDTFSDYTYFYGSLTAVVLLMLWVYICMNIFLYGAQINKYIPRLRVGKSIKIKIFEK